MSLADVRIRCQGSGPASAAQDARTSWSHRASGWGCPRGPAERGRQPFASCRADAVPSWFDLADGKARERMLHQGRGGTRLSTKTPVRSPRLDSLTVLRFFAALGVVFCHFVGLLHLHGFKAAVLLFGQFGVDFFFVLSGFVLTWSWKPQRRTARFYWLRFARIWPLHLVVLALMVACGSRGPAQNVVQEIFLVQQWPPTQSWRVGINGVTWTLSVEVFFYLLFPLLIRPFGRMSARVLVVLAVSGWLLTGIWYLAMRQPAGDSIIWVAATNPYVRLPQFFVGVAVALLVKRHGLGAPAAVAASLKVLGAALLAVTWGAFIVSQRHAYDGDLIPVWTFWVTPGIALVIAGFALSGLTRTGPIPRGLVALGEWSFALYLIHRAVIQMLLERLPALPKPLALIVLTIVAVMLSGLFYLVLERPAERWLRRRGPAETSEHRAAPASAHRT